MRHFLLVSLLALNSSAVIARTVSVEAPSTYSYEENSVRQLQVRGAYGRYITFIGKSVNSWAGTSGSPGKVTCTTIGTYTKCQTSGYIPPMAGGAENKNFTYELDCKDLTFDRKGDRSTPGLMRGWMSVENDPTASNVAKRFCPIIDTLPTGLTSANTKPPGESSVQHSEKGAEASAATNWSPQAEWTEYGVDDKGRKYYARRFGAEGENPISDGYHIEVNGEKVEDEDYTVWDCDASRYRYLDGDEWIDAEAGSIGYKEMRLICSP